MTSRRAAAALLALFRKRRLDRELEGELLAHLELAEQDAIAAGLSPMEARRVARVRFGGVEQMKEEHRDRRSVRWIETLVRDFRYGMASLVRNPGFAAVAIGVLALGIGANTAMFSLVDAVLLKPLPFPEPERIVRVWETTPHGGTNATSTLDFVDWRRLSNVYEALAAERSISAALTGAGEPARLEGKLVSADYFDVFGGGMLLGRTFREEDSEPGAEPVVVLSHAVWQGYFGGDPEIMSRRPVLDRQPRQVIGVLPPGVYDRDEARFWMPLVFDASNRTRDFHWLSVYGRLRKGVTLEQARAEMDRIDGALAEVTPAFKQDWTIEVERYDPMDGGELRQAIVIAFGAVAMVLLIACLNVANLLLARGAARRKEMAIRAALGAGRGRLAVQLLTESSVLCLLGAAAGVGIAYLLIQGAAPFLPDLIPYTAEVRLNVRVLAFAAGVALVVALVVGALPSMQVSWGGLARSMNRSGRGSSSGQSGLRRAIVVGEVGLSLVLLCGALLLFRSLLNLEKVETGIQIEQVITASVTLPTAAYPTQERAALFYDALAARLHAAPGVERAALTTHLPLRWIDDGEGLFVPGKEPINVRLKRVDPGYFDALNIPLQAGRWITGRDRAGAPGAIVINEVLAARLANDAGVHDPVGQPVEVTCPAYAARIGERREFEIVGVIRNERVNRLDRSDPPVVYVPFAQVPGLRLRLVVRTHADPASVVPSIRQAVREVDPDLPVGDIATMQQVRERTLSGVSRPAGLIGVFAAIAALLAALGLYGVLAHAVAEQRREIGIRMALGAQSSDVLSHILRAAFAMISVGLALGLAGAFAVTRVMRSLLYNVSALDPFALAIACISMTLVGFLAGFVPARRAARIDPMAVLREEG